MNLIGYAIISIPVLIFLHDQWKKYERAHPKPLPPKTPAELAREEAERKKTDEEIRQHNLRVREEVEAQSAEWRDNYKVYLRSPKWKRVRKRVLVEANYICAYCGRKATQVHHRKYPRGHTTGDFKRENYDYLEAVCAKCHIERHNL